MSKQNKVNPGSYTQAGRLSPDDAARERVKQGDAASPQHLEGRHHSRPQDPSPDDIEADDGEETVTEKDNRADEEEPEDSTEE